MKKVIFAMSILFALFSVSCKNSVKKGENYNINTKTVNVKWTAYKTTDKVPVSGKFNEVIIENIKKGTSVKDAVNGTTFKIPVSSIFTNNPDRDGKLKAFFFKTMIKTIYISGSVELNDDYEGNLTITMNGITKKLPISYSITNQLVKIEGIMDLKNWNAQTALESLNKACIDLHKGADGISKTWNEVKVEAAIYVAFSKATE